MFTTKIGCEMELSIKYIYQRVLRAFSRLVYGRVVQCENYVKMGAYFEELLEACIAAGLLMPHQAESNTVNDQHLFRAAPSATCLIVQYFTAIDIVPFKLG